MSQIEMVKIRAEVRIGTLVVATPYIIRFNVSKVRGRFSTFDASLKVSNTQVSGNIVGDNITIKAGRGSASTLIFTGFVRQVKVSPCMDDPSFVILNLSGADKLSYLEGKKYTRRCRASTGVFCTINSVQRDGLKSGKFGYRQRGVVETVRGDLNTQDNTVSSRDITAIKVQKAASTGASKGSPLSAVVGGR